MAKKTFKLGPIQRAWVRALRSGKYKQVTQELVDVSADGRPQGYCCLGVLCHLAVQKKVIKRNGATFDGEKGCLPSKVMEWAGMNDDLGGVYTSDSSLAEANDAGKSFREIAKIIEERAGDIFRESV